MDWIYEWDWAEGAPLRKIYRKFMLHYTGNMTTSYREEAGAYYLVDVPETKMTNVKRISKEEYEKGALCK